MTHNFCETVAMAVSPDEKLQLIVRIRVWHLCKTWPSEQHGNRGKHKRNKIATGEIA